MKKMHLKAVVLAMGIALMITVPGVFAQSTAQKETAPAETKTMGQVEKKTAVKEKTAVTWFWVNYPPAYFVSGENKGKGFADLAGEILRNHLTAYEHKLLGEVSPVRRKAFWEEEKEIYCTPGVGSAPGTIPHTIYSKPSTIVPPSGIVIRKNDSQKMAEAAGTPVSLEVLLGNPKFKFGMLPEGHFGEKIDPIIKKYSEKPNVYQRSGDDSFAFMQMLMAERIDYFIDYPFSFFFNREKLTPEERGSVIFLPLSEEREPKKAYTVCNNAPGAESLMTMINNILLTAEYQEPVIARMLEFVPENLREEYRQINKQGIGK